MQNSLAKIERQEREVDEYGKTVLRLRKGSSSRTTFNSTARQAGREAGKSIHIGNRATLGGGHKRLT